MSVYTLSEWKKLDRKTVQRYLDAAKKVEDIREEEFKKAQEK